MKWIYAHKNEILLFIYMSNTNTKNNKEQLHELFNELRMMGDDEDDLFCETMLYANINPPPRFQSNLESYKRIRTLYLDWYCMYDGRESYLMICELSDDTISILIEDFQKLLELHEKACTLATNEYS